MVLAVAWAVYLIPQAVRHHDEVARSRSVDRFSTAMRVLARREPVDRHSARLVVTPSRETSRVVTPSRVPSAAVRRAAARAAARRRRRVLAVLLVADLVVLTLAALSVLPWWAVAVPVTLTAAYLVLIRTQVRREDDATWTGPVARARTDESEAAPRRAIRVDSHYGTLAEPAVMAAADDDTMEIPVAALDAVAVAVETVDGGSLWDPLPVTLPTYVGKAKAGRTVRTIDLSAPGTWSSGRDEADSALVEQAAATEAAEAEVAADAEPRRAVGS